MRAIRAIHSELTDAEVRVVAERAHLASLREQSYGRLGPAKQRARG